MKELVGSVVELLKLNAINVVEVVEYKSLKRKKSQHLKLSKMLMERRKVAFESWK